MKSAENRSSPSNSERHGSPYGRRITTLAQALDVDPIFSEPEFAWQPDRLAIAAVEKFRGFHVRLSKQSIYKCVYITMRLHGRQASIRRSPAPFN